MKTLKAMTILLVLLTTFVAHAVGTNSGGGGNAAKQDFLRTGREVQNWLDENQNSEKIRPQVYSNDIAEALNPDRIVPVPAQIYDPKTRQMVDCFYDEASDTFLVYGIDGKGWLALKEKSVKWRLFLHEIFRKLHRTMPRYDDDKYNLTPQIEFLAFSRFDFSKVNPGNYERDHGDAGAYVSCNVNVGTDEDHQQVTLSMSTSCIHTSSGDNYTVTVVAKCSETTKFGSACTAPIDIEIFKGSGGFWSSAQKWETVKASMVMNFNRQGDIIVTVYDSTGKQMTDQGMRLLSKFR